MSIDQRNLPAFFNTDADFQTWCQGIAAQLVIAGMVKTTDTGQINNATVVKPAGTNTAQGYEIYKFSDALQASVPIFLKIEYGSGAAVDRPSYWVTAASNTNGAGTLTGSVTTRVQVLPSASKSAGVTLASYCSGDGSRVGLIANYDPASATFGIGFVIDRLRDGNGATTADGWALCTLMGSTLCGAQVVIGGAVQTLLSVGTNNGPFIGPSALGSSRKLGGGLSSNAGNVAVMPVIILNGQLRFLLQLAGYAVADITNVTSISVTTLGGTHTYLTFLVGIPLFVNNTPDAPALLWE